MLACSSRKRIEFHAGSRMAIMHGCIETHAAQEASKPN